jgi:hypothetical protein
MSIALDHVRFLLAHLAELECRIVEIEAGCDATIARAQQQAAAIVAEAREKAEAIRTAQAPGRLQ